MADQRKERRAPASLKVKYKSATVDQFVEQFGGDVSTGGMFIKTKTPLEIGALLKLELQLSDASPVIQGIGRVCWRRLPSDASPLPPGMGIKFQRLEEASRVTVERIVRGRGGSGSRFDQSEGAEIGDLSDAPDASMPPAAPAVSAKPAPPAAPRPSAARSPGLPPLTSETAPALRGASSETAPALRGGASLQPGAKPGPPAAPRPAAPPPRAPFASAAPKPVPSIRAAGATASPATSRAPVAGLFTESPMARATPEPAPPRARSSFFPAAPSVNGNAPPPAPAGISSRPPPAPVARNAAGTGAANAGSAPATSAPHIAGAFGGAPKLTPPKAPAPTRAEEEDAIDRLFEEVVQPRSTTPPAPVSEPAAGVFSEPVAADQGLFADDAAPAADWNASSSATTSLHSPPSLRTRAEEPPDFGDDQFGEADLAGNTSAPPGLGGDAGAALPIPSLSQPPLEPRKSSPWPWIAIAAVVLAAGGFIYLQRTNKPPPEAPIVTQLPSAPSASAAGAPAPAAEPAPAAGAAAPGSVEPSAAAAEPAAAAAAAAEPAAEPAPTAQMVAVEVTALPRGAEILVGDKLVGTAPMRVALPIGVASQLTLRSPGYASASKTVTATAEPQPERFKLEPLPYSVTVRTDPPGAEISVQGHSATAPGPLALGHLDGSVMMSVAKSGYQKVTRPLRLEEFIEQDGQMRAEVEVRLSPLPSGSRRRDRAREAPPAPAAPAIEPTPAAQGSSGTVTPVPEAKPETAPPAAEAAPPPAAPTPPPAPELPVQPPQ